MLAEVLLLDLLGNPLLVGSLRIVDYFGKGLGAVGGEKRAKRDGGRRPKGEEGSVQEFLRPRTMCLICFFLFLLMFLELLCVFCL